MPVSVFTVNKELSSPKLEVVEMSTPPYSSWKMQPLQPSLPTLEISVALFTVICLWLLARRRQAPLSFPTVPGWPLLGSLIELGSPSRLYEQLTAWAKVHGEAEGAYEFRLPGVRYVVVCKHELATELLAHRPFKLRRPALLRETVPFEGLFFAEGDKWRLDKRVVGPAFSHKHLKEYLHPIRRITERLIDVLAAQVVSLPTVSLP
jgi:cytochrome P450